MIIETSGGIGLHTLRRFSPLLLHREGDIKYIYVHAGQLKMACQALYVSSKLDSLNLFEQLITVKGVTKGRPRNYVDGVS